VTVLQPQRRALKPGCQLPPATITPDTSPDG
jgi:hypothetical protein